MKRSLLMKEEHSRHGRIAGELAARVAVGLQNAIAEAGAKVRFSYPWWLRPFVMRGMAGVTLGRRIYLAAEVPAGQLERLILHEIEHVRQIARVGPVFFYLRYLAEYARNRRAGMASAEAYGNISFEREAREAERGLVAAATEAARSAASEA